MPNNNRENREQLNNLLDLIENDKSTRLIQDAISLLIKLGTKNDLEHAKELSLYLLMERNNRFAYVYLSRIAYRNKNEEEYLDYLLKAYNNKLEKYSASFLANYYFNKKLYGESIKYLEYCINKFDDLFYIMSLGKCYYYLGQLDKAEELFKTMIEKNYNINSAYLYLGRVYLHKKDYDLALKNLSLNKDDNMKYLVYSEYGKIYLEKKEFNKAREYFYSLIENNFNVDYAKYQIAISYYLEKNYNKAKELFEKCLESSHRKYALMYLAKIYNLAKDPDSEKICYEKILEEGYDKTALFSLAKMEQNSETAKQLLQRIISTEYDEYALLELGRIYAKENDFQTAKYYISSIKELNKYSLMDLGIIEIELRNYSKALYYFKKIEETGYDEYALLYIGKCYHLLGDRLKATHYFNLLLNTNSRAFSLYELSKLDLENNNYIKAKEKLLEIISIVNDKSISYPSQTIYLYLAKCEYELGNIDSSNIYYDKYIELNNYELISNERKKLILSLM